jgi:predicted Na+-dependent transporter
MALQCNIDSRGKRARLISGVVMLIIALIVAGAWAWPARSELGWAVAIVLLTVGAFTIFEAWAGWCALRAMGVKTRV